GRALARHCHAAALIRQPVRGSAPAPGYLDQAAFPAVEADRGQGAAPDATGVDGVHAESLEQAQRGPVAADDRQLALGATRYRKPRVQAGLLRPRCTFLLEGNAAAWRAITQPRQHVDDGAQ